MLFTFLAVLGTVIVTFVTGLYLFLKWQYGFWARRKIAHSSPTFLLGDVKLDKNIGEVFGDLYHESSHEKLYGFWLLHRPILMVNDLELIRKVLLQDFQYFHSRGTYINEKDDPLSNHMFSMEGAKWKGVRSKLSPTFTSGKMKNMFPLVDDISLRMQKVLEPVAAKGGEIEARDVMGRYTTDIISSCIYGIDTNSLEDPSTMFREMGKKIFEPTRENMVRNSLAFLVPDFAKAIKLVQTNKDLAKFFRSAVLDTIDYRQKSNVKRNDFMQILVQLVTKGVIEDTDDKGGKGQTFTLDEAAAQAFVFFIGGFETTSSTLQFTCYELAKNQAIQDKLREEVLRTLKECDGQMNYDALFNMEYLGKILQETVRKFPPAAALMRQANDDYEIPELGFTIEKGTPVFISALGIQYDPRYYPDPEVFDPERFSEEEIAKRPKYCLLSFGEGPRFCIGQRFAYMQMRAALCALISKYKLEFCEKTPKVLKLDPKAFNLSPDGGMHLKITKI